MEVSGVNPFVRIVLYQPQPQKKRRLEAYAKLVVVVNVVIVVYLILIQYIIIICFFHIVRD